MNNDLSHYGILGQRWGIRRTKTRFSKAGKYSKKSSNEEKKRSAKDMSDDELRKKVNRLQMERQYSQLSSSNVSKGRDYVNKAIKVGTTVAAVTTTALTLYNNAQKIKNIIEGAKG